MSSANIQFFISPCFLEMFFFGSVIAWYLTLFEEYIASLCGPLSVLFGYCLLHSKRDSKGLN